MAPQKPVIDTKRLPELKATVEHKIKQAIQEFEAITQTVVVTSVGINREVMGYPKEPSHTVISRVSVDVKIEPIRNG